MTETGASVAGFNSLTSPTTRFDPTLPVQVEVEQATLTDALIERTENWVNAASTSSTVQDQDVAFRSIALRRNIEIPHIDIYVPSAPLHLLPHGHERLVAVANAAFFERDDTGAIRGGVGGLVTALNPILKNWPGSVTISPDVEGKLGSIGEDLPFTVAPVRLGRPEFVRYYEEVANGLLWPAMHSLNHHVVNPSPEAWRDYFQVNCKFAADTLKDLRPGDFVWVHDYHLMLAPDLIRSKAPDTTVGYFHHIPWPSPESFAEKVSSDQREQILRGLLGSDLVAFQTQGDATNFLRCVRAAGFADEVQFSTNSVSINGRTVSVGAFPISTDPLLINEKLRGGEVDKYEQELRARYPKEEILFGVDRNDYTKGIDNRIWAMGELFHSRPELIGHVRLVQNCSPTREGCPEYQRYRQQVAEAADKINMEFGTESWQPVVLTFEKFSQDKVFGYGRAADVILVTPLADGMNLVAKELGWVSRPDTAMVIGEGAGAAEELSEATLVEGGSPKSIAHGISEALSARKNQPELVMAKNLKIKEQIAKFPLSRWAEDITMAAAEARDRRNENVLYIKEGGVLQRKTEQRHPPHVSIGKSRAFYADVEDLATEAANAGYLLALSDFDGTLTPLVLRPDFARPDPEVISDLIGLAHAPNTQVAIVSGRSVDQLLDFLGPTATGQPIYLCGLHGGEIYNLQTGQYVLRPDESFGLAAANFMEELEVKTQGLGLLIEDKEFGVALHYREAPDQKDAAIRIMTELRNDPRFDAFEIRHGKMVVEIVPPGCSKDRAVEYLYALPYSNYGPGPLVTNDKRVVFIGDDITDERAYPKAQQLDPRAITIRVGERSVRTAAHSRLESPAQVHDLIRAITRYRIVDGMRAADSAMNVAATN